MSLALPSQRIGVATVQQAGLLRGLRLPRRLGMAVRWLGQSTAVWLLSLAAGALLLSGWAQTGLQHQQQVLMAQRVQPLLQDLVPQLETRLAPAPSAGGAAGLQPVLDQALAQTGALEALWVVDLQGRRLVGAGPQDPFAADAALARRPLQDASGRTVAALLAFGAEPAVTPVVPGRWVVALGLPLLAVALAWVARQRRPAPRAAASRWGLALALWSVVAGLLLAGLAGRLQRPLDQAEAEPAQRAAVLLAQRIGHALEAGVPLQRLEGLNAWLHQRLRQSTGIAEISLVDAQAQLLAVQGGTERADSQRPALRVDVLQQGRRVAQVLVQPAVPRTPWLLINLLAVASALVAVGLLLVGHELNAAPARPAAGPALAEPMAGVLTGAALALTAVVLVRADTTLALAALLGAALLLLATGVTWRWGRAQAAPRLLAGLLLGLAWCLVQG